MREDFIAIYSQKSKDYEDKAKDYVKRDDSQMIRKAAVAVLVNVSGWLMFGLPGLVLGAGINCKFNTGFTKAVNSSNTVKDLSWYQYQLLLREFVFNGLSKFMEA